MQSRVPLGPGKFHVVVLVEPNEDSSLSRATSVPCGPVSLLCDHDACLNFDFKEYSSLYKLEKKWAVKYKLQLKPRNKNHPYLLLMQIQMKAITTTRNKPIAVESKTSHKVFPVRYFCS